MLNAPSPACNATLVQVKTNNLMLWNVTLSPKNLSDWAYKPSQSQMLVTQSGYCVIKIYVAVSM